MKKDADSGIRVVIKQPGKRPIDAWLSAALVKELQSEVGKSISELRQDSRYSLIYTKNGKAEGRELCMRTGVVEIYGDVVLIGKKRGRWWTDAPMTAAEFERIYPERGQGK